LQARSRSTHFQREVRGRDADKATYKDIRDDRVYTYFDLKAGEKKQFTVLLNASYMGTYYLPALQAEAMYDNSIYAGVIGQWVKVVE
jgi:alpha-2-macroglobulin